VLRLVELVPLSNVRLPGVYDRSAGAPGPGVVMQDVRVLPRLETLVGALAQPQPGDRLTLADALESLARRLGVGGGLVVGPFLAVKRGGGWRVYVDVGSGLFNAAEIDKYMGYAGWLRDTANELLPRGRSGWFRALHRPVESLKEYLSGEPGCGDCGEYFIEAELIVQKRTRIALEPRRKGPAYGLMFSVLEADYWRAGKQPRIIIAVLGEEQDAASGRGNAEGLVFLSPGQTPLRVRTHSRSQESGISVPEPLCRGELLVLSDMPVEPLGEGPGPGLAAYPVYPAREGGGCGGECSSGGVPVEGLFHPLEPGGVPTRLYSRVEYEEYPGRARRSRPCMGVVPGTLVETACEAGFTGSLGLARALSPKALRRVAREVVEALEG